ncbi:unnamed protein product [Adineta steineri]|uniref:EGF-like domain-containing protein n=1 Tax=Adineta steineri TaxID=433720 RepID=A0A814ZDF4_9BILA|nr:unnamed protein product [Adineta steineri]
MLSIKDIFVQFIIIFTTSGLSKSVELCVGNSTANDKPLFLITFGNGTQDFSSNTSADFKFFTDHEQRFGPTIDHDQFAFVNKVPHHKTDWHDGVLDHTENDTNGYVFVIDIRAERGTVLFQSTVSGLCAGQNYEFSAYLASLNKKDTSDIKSNVQFQVRAPEITDKCLAQKNTGDIRQHDWMRWSKHCLSFNAPNSTVVLLMISNVYGRGGNDIAIDDIELRICPNQTCSSCSADLTADKCVAPTTTTTSTSTTSTTTSTTPTSTTTTSTSTTSTSTTTSTTSTSTTSSTTLTSTITSTASRTSTSMTTSSTSSSTTTSTTSTSTTTSTTSTSTTTSITSTSTTTSTTSTTSITTSTTSTSTTTSTTTAIPTTSTTSTARNVNTVAEQSPLFISKSCNDSTSIGQNCNISASPCEITNFCQNNGNCTDDNTTSYGYICLCPFGFNGINCELDNRLCKPHICLNHGECNETSNTTLDCLCDNGWEVVEQSPLFIPKSCNDSTSIGLNCNISASSCKIANPCQNDGNCSDDNTTSYGYICLCPFDFHGINCELDNRLCKPHTCLNHGTCNETSDTTFDCLCDNGWEGNHCESMINYCSNITCENSAICRPLLLNYTCECLSNNYYGRHCEFSTTKIIIYKIISKSFAYIAIIAMTIVAMFVVIMDILTYCFGIDLTREERERFRREKRGRRWNRSANQNLIYVNALSESFNKSKTTIVKNRV